MSDSLHSIAFIDGSIDVNKASEFSRGSAAAVLIAVKDGIVQRIRIETTYHEGFDTVTNSRMELRGVEIVVRLAKRKQMIYTWSDSMYAIGVLSGRLKKKANIELIDDISKGAEEKGLDLTLGHIGAHKGFFFNELADYAAKETVERGRSLSMMITPKRLDVKCSMCERFMYCLTFRKTGITLPVMKNIIRKLMGQDWTNCGEYVPYSTMIIRRRPMTSAGGSIRS